MQITARDFAQTLGLLERFGIDHTVVGRHRGGRLAAKGVGLLSRSTALARWARGRGFDLAFGHGSNDVTVAARLLRIPCSTMFDYEWATVQHTVNCRLARTVVVPEAIPPERLARYGATRQDRRVSGPQGGVLPRGLRARPGGPRRAGPRSLEADRGHPDAAGGVAVPPLRERRARRRARARLEGEQTVVLPRTPQQRAELAGRDFIVPEHAIDAQSLIAYADLVVSAGGTMNREAVALGTPVWTTFQGRLGAVDEQLIADGRMKVLERSDDVVFEKRAADGRAKDRIRRDPALLADLLGRASRP